MLYICYKCYACNIYYKCYVRDSKINRLSIESNKGLIYNMGKFAIDKQAYKQRPGNA